MTLWAAIMKENNANVASQTDIDYVQVLTDIRNMKNHFKLKNFLMNVSFGLAPSAWDITTDFSFAEKLEDKAFASLSLLFISLPGIVYFLTLFQQALEMEMEMSNCPTVVKTLISHVSSFCLIAGILYGLSILVLSDSPAAANLVCKILALTVATLVLAIKTVGVFVHTESVMRVHSSPHFNYSS